MRCPGYDPNPSIPQKTEHSFGDVARAVIHQSSGTWDELFGIVSIEKLSKILSLYLIFVVTSPTFAGNGGI
jgi:hypothetical protein